MKTITIPVKLSPSSVWQMSAMVATGRAIPYLPPGRELKYVPENNEYMRMAKAMAQELSTNPNTKTGAVIIKNNRICGWGANESGFHKKNGCVRIAQNCKTGEGYDLCPGCGPEFHAEPRAISMALELGREPRGGDLYLWGHWWVCQNCWKSIIDAGIVNVFLSENTDEQYRLAQEQRKLRQMGSDRRNDA